MDAVERIPRMRTVAKIVTEIKVLDPNSEVTEYYVRQLVRSSAVKVVWAGRKALINLDDVLELLQLGTAQPAEDIIPAMGGIRRINPERTK